MSAPHIGPDAPGPALVTHVPEQQRDAAGDRHRTADTYASRALSTWPAILLVRTAAPPRTIQCPSPARPWHVKMPVLAVPGADRSWLDVLRQLPGSRPVWQSQCVRIIRAHLEGAEAEAGRIAAADVARIIIGLERAIASAAYLVLRRPRRGAGRHAQAIESAARLRFVGIESGSFVEILALPEPSGRSIEHGEPS